MNGVPDHTDQRELLKSFIGESHPATLEAIAAFVEGSSGSYHCNTSRDQMEESALVEVELGPDTGLLARLEQMREARRAQQPGHP